MNTAGVAVFIVDSFKPRGVSETAQDQSLVSPASQIADAMNALKLLATHPKIDSTRIFNIGFSRGGSTAFYTAWPMYQRPVDTNGAKFAGHIPVYPGNCDIRYRADANVKATAPVFMALADVEGEDWQNGATCIRYAQELASAGQPVTFKEYKGTYHAFDGRVKFFYFNNAYVSTKCDMEVQMTDVAGGGLGRDAKDLKTGKTLTSYDDWNTAAKACISNVRARVGGDEKQSNVLVQDVLNFMGVK
jgi:dienelactone hydrolase